MLSDSVSGGRLIESVKDSVQHAWIGTEVLSLQTYEDEFIILLKNLQQQMPKGF